MQIGNIFQQLQNTLGTTSTEAVSNSQSTVKTGSVDGSLLTAGNVFEGTVTSNGKGQVTISLSNGQTMSARLDEGVTVKVGEPLFFQVKGQNA
ncbi:MAG: flagellar hook-length control protein FliK, partial [Eubacterium sp.]|nr:flagellar hook-length control protein FliK [Eubacterium sp.]